MLFTFTSLPRLNDNKTVPALNNLPRKIKSSKRNFGSLLHDTSFNIATYFLKSISLLSTKTGSFMHQDNSHLGGSDDKARLESVLRGDFSVLCS